MVDAKPPHLGLRPEVRMTGLGGGEARPDDFADQVRRGRAHDDLRDWLQMADELGELRVLEGADRDEDIGRITEMLHHTDGAPAVLFDAIGGFPRGHRILVNAQGERSRLALTLGLPPDIGVWELVDELVKLQLHNKAQLVRYALEQGIE